MINTDSELRKEVSFQENSWSKIQNQQLLRTVLSDIGSGKYRKIVESLRTLLSKDEIEKYTSQKKHLPAVTFSGQFSINKSRNYENLISYNEIIVIDIDKVDGSKMQDMSKILAQENFVFSFWRSPSNFGFKGLVKVEPEGFEIDDIECFHKAAFRKLVTYFMDCYGIELDKSGSDPTRLCFYSYDPSLLIKDSFSPFFISKDDIISVLKRRPKGKFSKLPKDIDRDLLYNPKGKNLACDRVRIQSIIKFLSKRKLSITSDFGSWVRVAFAIANTFTFDIGKKYYLQLCRLDGKNHNEHKSEILLTNCYHTNRREILFATIIHLARRLGYKIGESS